MRTIRVKKIKPQTILHFAPNGVPLGYLNELESAYLRLKVMKTGQEGYYALFRHQRLYISPEYGHYSSYPKGFYNQTEDALKKIIFFRIRKNKEIEEPLKSFSLG